MDGAVVLSQKSVLILVQIIQAEPRAAGGLILPEVLTY